MIRSTTPIARKVKRALPKIARGLLWLATISAITTLVITTWVDRQANPDRASDSDLGGLILNIVLLLITATTLHFTIPDPARIWLERQAELGLSDLLFFIVGDSAQGRPRDILLQLHVAVSNIGGRKAVLSKVELDALLDRDGDPVDLRFERVGGTQYSTKNRWVEMFARPGGQWIGAERFTIRDERPA